jgi:hypothetical protein
MGGKKDRKYKKVTEMNGAKYRKETREVQNGYPSLPIEHFALDNRCFINL